jgi:hypothetical protein
LEQKCSKCSEIKEIRSRGLCKQCYYIEWYYGGEEPKRKVKQKQDFCVQCNREIDSIDHKGKVVTRGNSTLCKTCYSRDYQNRKTDVCGNCNIKMSRATVKGLCNFCINEMNEEKEIMDTSDLLLTGRQKKKDKNSKKEMPVNIAITKKQREEIRRLLVIYKNGLQTLVEPFRLVSLYVELYSDVELDSYTEESQVIIVLRTFKKLFNAPFIELKENPIKKNYKAENPYAAAKRREKYQQNKEKVALYMKKWRENNPDKIESYKNRKK